MENLKIRVTTEQESKEVQKLFFELGYGWHGKGKLVSYLDEILSNGFGWLVLWKPSYLTNTVIQMGSGFEDCKEITLQELRDMVKPKVKEYLDPDNGYDFIKWTGFAHPPESFIEVPEGADVYARCNIFGDYKWLPKIIDGDWSVLWQREKETLSDKVATAEVARQEEKHSHYKKDVSHLNVIDVYRVLELYGVESHAVGHAIKKLLCCGQRGAKGRKQDIQEAIDSLNRELEMVTEDEL